MLRWILAQLLEQRSPSSNWASLTRRWRSKDFGGQSSGFSFRSRTNLRLLDLQSPRLWGSARWDFVRHSLASECPRGALGRLVLAVQPLAFESTRPRQRGRHPKRRWGLPLASKAPDRYTRPSTLPSQPSPPGQFHRFPLQGSECESGIEHSVCRPPHLVHDVAAFGKETAQEIVRPWVPWPILLDRSCSSCSASGGPCSSSRNFFVAHAPCQACLAEYAKASDGPILRISPQVSSALL